MPAMICLLVALPGCGKPSETARDNRRLYDAILTAVTLKNPTELAKDEKLLEARHADGSLSDSAYQAVTAAIAKARGGLWTEAEKDLYKFRDENPFPR
ncbi:MAG: hypothetical protein K2Y37_26175 [Pirellulales bacterium]|nr:hypothetical protein [Pirellulales bacterium]